MKDHDTERQITGENVSGSVASLVNRDPAQFEIALRPWELLCRPSESGDFSHTVTMVKTTAFMMYREHFSLANHVQGLTPENCLVFSIPMYAGTRARYWGVSHQTNTMPVTIAGELDVNVEADHCHLVTIIDLSYLRDCVSEQVLEQLTQIARSRVMTVSVDLLRDYWVWGNRIIDLAISHPATIESAATIFNIQQELLSHLVRFVDPVPYFPDKFPKPLRQIGFQRALEYMRNNLERRISIIELCDVSGISERSLQYAFKDAFGMTPGQFMRRRRLHAVRRSLRTCAPNHKNVSEIATEHGFYEFGRFAAEYKQIFGKLPSHTLALDR